MHAVRLCSSAKAAESEARSVCSTLTAVLAISRVSTVAHTIQQHMITMTNVATRSSMLSTQVLATTRVAQCASAMDMGYVKLERSI